MQIPSQLVAERVGLPYWIGFLMVGWGITATLMAGLTSSPTHLYLLRFLLGESMTSALRIPRSTQNARQLLCLKCNQGQPPDQPLAYVWILLLTHYTLMYTGGSRDV